MSNRQVDALPSRGNILIVDDAPLSLRLLSQMLVDEGYQVKTAIDGMQALEAVQKTSFDLILLDIMMPEMNGFQVCERLKEDERTRDVPIIFLSVLGETKDKINAFTIGGMDYVTKPFHVKEVLARIGTHVALRNLQKQLQQANRKLERQVEELKARNEELDAFAHTAAHDLRGPLTLIISFAEALEGIYTTLPEEEVRESMRSIARSGRKMDQIIEELLSLAELRRAEKVKMEPLDMASIVDAAKKRLFTVMDEHQMEIVTPDAWPTALGYAPWVEDVWVSYISNAVQSSSQPPRVELGATAEVGNTVRFWGRDLNTLERTPDRQRDDKGGGLGAVFVRRIMEKMGRQARAEVPSDEDQDYLFTFTLSGLAEK
jgi:two-component system sensor histidine kinase/response regulator